MRKIAKIFTVVTVLSLTVLLAGVAQPENLQETEPVQFEGLVESAEGMVDSLSEAQWQAARKNFTDQIKAALPADKLRETWGSLLSNFGDYEGRQYSRTAKEGDHRVVYVTMKFEKINLDAKVVFNEEDMIAGLRFVPTASWTQPEYADHSKFSEKQVAIGEGEWELPGTLTLPEGEGPFPAIVLVHGSGASDRDETFGPNKPFKDIAWGLATRGISVLRYPKRAYQYPKKITELENQTVYVEAIEDALAAVDTARNQDEIDSENVYVLGHSLGGMLLPRIYNGDTEISGFIALAAPSGSLAEQILEQVKYLSNLDSEVTEEEKNNIRETKKLVERIQDSSLDPDTPAEELMGAPGSYWIDLREYNQLKMAQKIDKPLLILQGERDYQVTMEDFRAWMSALEEKEKANFISYPELNHLFMPGEGQSNPSEYYSFSHVSEEVIEDIANWIKQ